MHEYHAQQHAIQIHKKKRRDLKYVLSSFESSTGPPGSWSIGGPLSFYTIRAFFLWLRNILNIVLCRRHHHHEKHSLQGKTGKTHGVSLTFLIASVISLNIFMDQIARFAKGVHAMHKSSHKNKPFHWLYHVAVYSG